MFEKGTRGNTLHGILLIALFSFAAFYIAEIPFVKSLSFSPLIVGIILGMLYANSLRNRLPETWVPGIKFCTKQILRTGIVLYGFRLTLADVAAVGLPAITIDAIIVAGTIFLGLAFGKLLKLDNDTSLMTSTGSAICGAAAVLGAEPVVKCEGHKTAIAVSTVVIFGTISMFIYPIMYRAGILSGILRFLRWLIRKHFLQRFHNFADGHIRHGSLFLGCFFLQGFLAGIEQLFNADRDGIVVNLLRFLSRRSVSFSIFRFQPFAFLCFAFVLKIFLRDDDVLAFQLRASVFVSK